MPETPSLSTARLRRAVGCFLLDLVTAEVIVAMRVEQIRCIVLKGPSIAHWLYDEPDRRRYVDSDLLVPPSQLHASEEVLIRLGFQREPGDEDPAVPGPHHGHHWRRSADSARVDLHWTLAGVGAPPFEVWQAMEEHATVLPIAGIEADVPDRVATAVIVCLHAAWHGREHAQPQEDLARALAHFEIDVWREAALLAARMRATDAFTGGLRLDPGGSALADQLSLPAGLPFEVVLSASHKRLGAFALYRFATTPGTRAKARLAGRKLVPPSSFMRLMSPLARRGRLGLAAAYLWRPFVLTWRLGFALRALWRAHLESR